MRSMISGIIGIFLGIVLIINTGSLFSLILFGGGVYLIFHSLNLKKSSTITGNGSIVCAEVKKTSYAKSSSDEDIFKNQRRMESIRHIIHSFDKEYHEENCFLLYFDPFTSREIVIHQWIYMMRKGVEYEAVYVKRHTDHGLSPENETTVTKQEKAIPLEILTGNTVYDSIEYTKSPSKNLAAFIKTYFRIEINPQRAKACIEAITK